MTDLIARADAYAQLRCDVDYGTSPDDPWLDVWIPAVCAAVLGWLKEPWRAYEQELDSFGEPLLDSSGDPVSLLDSSSNPVVLAVVKGACLVELERQYNNRDGSGKGQTDVPVESGGGYTLGRAATALLAGLRKTTVA